MNFRFSLLLILISASLNLSVQPALASGPERVIYRFKGQDADDGAMPGYGIVTDKVGNLYGVTQSGGTAGCGTVFELVRPATAGASWTENILYNFTGTTDGCGPAWGLTFDEGGNLYGGAGDVAFELSPTGVQGAAWVPTTLYTFTDTKFSFTGRFTIDSAGNLFGERALEPCCDAGGYVFELSPINPHNGNNWTETLLYAFERSRDGLWPAWGLTRGRTGDLYGTTLGGGLGFGFGVVFHLLAPATPGAAWTERVLHRFSGGADGNIPTGGLVRDKNGNLYGLTAGGGEQHYGVAFELSPIGGGNWTETTLYNFPGPPGLANPAGGMAMDKDGNLYGTAANIGFPAPAQIFQLTPPVAEGSSWAEHTLYTFSYIRPFFDGVSPQGLTFEPWGGGALYGTTFAGGGWQRYGTVFKLTPLTPHFQLDIQPATSVTSAGGDTR
jgi:hypothetical protein